MMGGLKRIVLCLVLLVATSGWATAETIRLEAENLVNSYDHIGSVPITSVPCGGASGGRAIEGFDIEGEWIELRLVLDRPVDCLYGIQSAGNLGEVRQYSVAFLPASGQSASPQGTLMTPPGSGIG